MNVFKEMILSIYSYETYSQFLKNKKAKVFGFGVLLMVLYFVLTMILPGIIYSSPLLNLEEYLRKNVPDFSLEDGVLWVDDVVEIDSGTAYLSVNTNLVNIIEDASKFEQSYRGYSSVMILDAEKMIVKSDGKWQMAYFSDMGFDFDKEGVIKFVPWLYAFYIIFLIFAFIFMTAFFFFGVLFVALIGMIIASSMNYQITFGQLYLLGIYSRTLPLLIKAIVSLLMLRIPFFWILNFGLSAIIIVLAITKMKEQRPEMPEGTPYSGDSM